MQPRGPRRSGFSFLSKKFGNESAALQVLAHELCGPATWSLLGGYRANDELAAALGWERGLCVRNGRGHERFDLRTNQVSCRFQADEARLIAGAKQQFVRIMKSSAMDEANAHAIGPGSHGDNAIRWAFR